MTAMPSKEIIHGEPTSIVETHLGTVKPTLRLELETMVARAIFVADSGVSPAVTETIDAILDRLHAAMSFRTAWGALVIQRIKRGDEL